MAAGIYETPNGFNPNARYNIGPNAAGCGRCSNQMSDELNVEKGIMSDGHVAFTNLFVGQNVAGASRSGNTGGNIAGADKSQTDALDNVIVVVPPPL